MSGSFSFRRRAGAWSDRTCVTPARMSALAEVPSVAARAFSRRYKASGMSTVVRMAHSAIFMAAS